MSVPDAGHRAAIIHADQTEPIVKFGYTLTRRVQDPTWTVNFTYREKTLSLNNVMGSDYPVTTGTQLWQNIITWIDQTIMQDVNVASASLKTAKNKSATVLLKKEWKPTFEWQRDNLVLKAVDYQDVFALDSLAKV